MKSVLYTLDENGKIVNHETLNNWDDQGTYYLNLDSYIEMITKHVELERVIPINFGILEEDCVHDYKEYVGLMERYFYCVKCDEKKQ